MEYFSKIKNIILNYKEELNRKGLMEEIFKSGLNNSKDAVYLGDSVYLRIASEDLDKRSLKNLIEQENAGSVVFAKQGLYSLHFLVIVAYLLDINAKFKEIVIPINIRSFSPQWSMNPNWRRENKIEYVKSLLLNPLISDLVASSLPPKVSKNDYLSSCIKMLGYDNSYSIKEYLDYINKSTDDALDLNIRKKKIFSMHYMGVIEKDNFVLKCWVALLELLRKHDKNIYLYYTPINYRYGLELFGSDFNDVINYNIKTISHSIKPHVALDLTNLIDSSGFFSVSETTEHLNYKGRISLFNVLNQHI